MTLHSWDLPLPTICAFLFCCTGRSVCSSIFGQIGPPRRLLRSVGMGGPASPFLWAIGFDPILHFLCAVLQCDSPTYVDDLAALIRGPAQLLLAQVSLLALSKLAGLNIRGASPSWLASPSHNSLIQHILAPLPVVVTPDATGGCHIHGLPAPLLVSLLTPLLPPSWPASTTTHAYPHPALIAPNPHPQESV